MNILVSCHVRWFNAEAFYALTLAELFHHHGHRVLLSTHPDSFLACRAKEKGIPVDERMNLLSSNPLYLLKAMLQYRRLIRKYQPDLITVHRSESFFFTVLAQYLSGQKPCILRFRGDPRPPRNSSLNRWLYRDRCQGIIVSGRQLKIKIEDRLSLNPEHISVIYAPVDTNVFKPPLDKSEVKNKFHFNSKKPVVGIVGRIGKVKGHSYLLDMIERIPDTDKIQYFVAYHEEHEGVQILKHEVAERKLDDRITFFGFMNNINELVAAADIGVISSVGSEANCRVALEFLATGIPLVATNVGVIPEVVQNETTGFIVPPRKPGVSAEKVRLLIRDSELRLRMGCNARIHAEQRFSHSIFYKSVQELIQKKCPKQKR